MFETLLIANRGEIAVRVIRACRELGIRSVAVHSEADARAPHALLADVSVPIGPPEASRSYLSVDALLEAARRTGAEAVHPGYGFLAENAEFARRVEEAGLRFVGPPAAAIAAMGDKPTARARMREAGVPVVPGSEGPVEELDDARREAEAIGWPVLLKAAGGGGGKGMRVVRSGDELERALAAARREAAQAFGDERVYLERYLEAPRHIEIQVLADGEGRTVHLGERECSIQRRHQKLIEEAPSPVVTPELRARMGDVAIAAARAVGYESAGTVEFLYAGGEFFFLEMNTRIQVEHPVTELVTGVDLVREQIRIAAGCGIDWEPSPQWPRGHAIECRIGGEDPFRDFLPSAGRITGLRVPSGPGVRWDGGIDAGFEVGLHYDPLLGKLIVHDADRSRAIARMRRALEELRIGGIRTTQPFHLAVLAEEDFRAGRLDVRYVERHPELLTGETATRQELAAAVAAVLLEARAEGPAAAAAREADAPGDGRGGWSAWRRAFAPR